MIKLSTLKEVISMTDPKLIPKDFVMAASVQVGDEEPIDIPVSELHAFLESDKGKQCKVFLVTDIGKMAKTIDDTVNGILSRITEQI